jgi:sucrose phosphorylase
VYGKLADLLSVRREHAAFHPEGRQRVLDLDPRLFSVERESPNGAETILAVINLCAERVSISPPFNGRRDLVSGRNFGGEIGVEPYGVLWLIKD